MDLAGVHAARSDERIIGGGCEPKVHPHVFQIPDAFRFPVAQAHSPPSRIITCSGVEQGLTEQLLDLVPAGGIVHFVPPFAGSSNQMLPVNWI